MTYQGPRVPLLADVSPFDATRICSRAAAPDAWACPIPVRVRAAVPVVPFSWRSMVRNPHALVVSAAVGALVAKDAVVRALAIQVV